MKVIVCQTPGSFELIEKEMPAPAPGFSIIQIKRIGVCGTDLHAFAGNQPFFSYPRVLGHELAAEFVEGDAAGFVKGEALTIVPYFMCGNCIACRNGKPNCCAAIKVFGVHIDGGMSAYVSVPSYALVKSGGLTLDQLALVEPLAIGAHAVSRAQVVPGEKILVVGAGPIGIGLVLFAQLAGAEVVLMDTNDERLQFCRNHFAVSHTINPLQQDAIDMLKEFTTGDMPSVVIDATGSQRAINNAFAYMAHGGKYILVGLQLGEISFSHPEFHKREATLMSSRNATKADFSHVMDAIASGRIDPLPMITHRLLFDEVVDSFSTLSDPSNKVVKAMIDC
jgi:2-desacetyl-2-hydroxyethyl bacteriochlorophyllide A dehydrogenase